MAQSVSVLHKGVPGDPWHYDEETKRDEDRHPPDRIRYHRRDLTSPEAEFGLYVIASYPNRGWLASTSDAQPIVRTKPDTP